MGFCVLLLLMSISVSLLSVGASDGIIVPGKYISANQSMISASENFALGFFSLGNSTPRYYLGIWYNKVQKKSVVFWVANRESLTDSLGTVDGFLNFENVKLPDHSYLLRNMSAKDGESRYLNNCSCTAYSYVNASEETSGTCLNWHGDLVDLLKEFVAPDLYVCIHDRKLAGNDRSSNKFTCKTMDIIFAVAAVSVGLLSVLFGNFIWRKNYGKQDPSGKVNLDWTKSFRIIAGIAQGLLYIHKYSRLKVIHRDLKSSNIILDEAMNPKISDFRMA